jgi:hypothetical protein
LPADVPKTPRHAGQLAGLTSVEGESDGVTRQVYIEPEGSGHEVGEDLKPTCAGVELSVSPGFCCSAPLLLHLTGKKYMHIGHGITEFTIDDKVDDYFSLVGNNDVPYPILLGTENVYFLLDNAYYPRSAFTAKMSKLDWEDAYQYYFGFKDLATGEKVECKQASLPARKNCIKERGDKVKEITKRYEKKMKGVKITN